MNKTFRLIDADWPDYAAAQALPFRSADIYRRRLAATRERMERTGIETLVVYADREHFGTMVWLTGFDPRFEEALLVIRHDRPPLFVVGNDARDISAPARCLRPVKCGTNGSRPFP
ncbi:MAG: hypothetical protein Q8K28_08100 [Hoeflea sp.]|uniref:hypothetical protein n=1 Tax=Hoeflea sp. TaxID=1940281 RepID=UPI00272EFF0F|nr:hypothetical protein [Hoeflea sp.]MDP2119849.1 hypothetical protein [Hoeflea sp.]